MKVTVSRLRDLLHEYFSDEISMSRFAELLNERPMQELTKANELLRSVHAVVQRKGADTNWEALEGQLSALLQEQHRILYPEQYR
jgi:hypothetical protein